jgi:predicted transcriptional regulator
LSVSRKATVDLLKASETDLKNIVYQETDHGEVAEYRYAQMRHECIMWMELHEASDLDLVHCYKSLQKLNEDSRSCGQN